MNEKLNKFRNSHKDFLGRLCDDTWLRDEPITAEDVIICYEWCLHIKEEFVPTNKFENTFGITLQELADWWNKEILKL